MAESTKDACGGIKNPVPKDISEMEKKIKAMEREKKKPAKKQPKK